MIKWKYICFQVNYLLLSPIDYVICVLPQAKEQIFKPERKCEAMVHTSNCVRKYFQPEIEKLGFEHKFHNREKWRFMRQKGEVEQYIDLDFYYLNTALRLYFATNAFGRNPIDAGMVATKEEYPCNMVEMLPFSNEEELIGLLQMCAEICRKYADKALDEISEPISQYWPTEKEEAELYETHSERIEQLKQRYHINHDSSEEDYINAIKSLIRNISEESKEVFLQSIINAAALLGALYVVKIGGKWELNRICTVVNIGNNPNLRAYLINNIYLSWQRKDDSLFLRHYNNIKKKI